VPVALLLRLLLPFLRLLLPLKNLQACPDDFAGILVPAGGDLRTDERVQLRREGDIAGLV
jgi:hypothetical protein